MPCWYWGEYHFMPHGYYGLFFLWLDMIRYIVHGSKCYCLGWEGPLYMLVLFLSLYFYFTCHGQAHLIHLNYVIIFQQVAILPVSVAGKKMGAVGGWNMSIYGNRGSHTSYQIVFTFPSVLIFQKMIIVAVLQAALIRNPLIVKPHYCSKCWNWKGIDKEKI